MRKELEYFYIENKFGGYQDWLTDPMMKLGGCAAVAACDSCIYFDLYYNKNLYPFNKQNLNKKDYIEFSKIMKPYLRPRWQGIDRLDIYVEGFNKYLKNAGENEIKIDEFSGEENVNDAKKLIKKQIDNGLLVPYLLLNHKDLYLKDYEWHWFLITGYEEFENIFMVKATTYGESQWIDLERFWDTGYKNKGGIILYLNA